MSIIRLLTRAIRNVILKNPVTAVALNIPLISLLMGYVQPKSEVQISRESFEKIQKSQIYFKNKPISEIVQEADQLFERGKFMEVYELLNRLKFNNNAEVQWRISRALFKLSKDESVSNELRKEMIHEAFEIIQSTVGLVPTKMSLASVHPVEVHSSHSSLTTLSHSLDDISSWSSQVEQVMTIEQLRDHMTSCFTCGVSWADHHVSLDCSECGGYAMERPCPTCDGTCGSTWKRDLTMSHASSKARWQGECRSYASPPTPPPPPKDPAATLIAQELCQRLEKLSANS